MSFIERYIKHARNTSENSNQKEAAKNIQLFKKLCTAIYDTTFVELFSTHVFPETVKTKAGEKYLLWDQAYWGIVGNIVNLYFLSAFAMCDKERESVKGRLEAEIYYFLSLKLEDYPALSMELARSYRELVKEPTEISIPSEEVLQKYLTSLNESINIAKIFCLFHELNHIEAIEDIDIYLDKSKTILDTFRVVEVALDDDSPLIERLSHYYNKSDIWEAISDLKNQENEDLLVELSCDLSAFYDTIDLCKTLMPDTSEETIVGKVHEVNLLINTINFTLVQTYKNWDCSYRLCMSQIKSEEYDKEIEHLNKDTLLRFVLSDIVKAVQIIKADVDDFDNVINMVNSDHYGFRYPVENSFLESVMEAVNDKSFFLKVFSIIQQYNDLSEIEMEEYKTLLLGW